VIQNINDIIKALGGEISVQTAGAIGTEFIVQLNNKR